MVSTQILMNEFEITVEKLDEGYIVSVRYEVQEAIELDLSLNTTAGGSVRTRTRVKYERRACRNSTEAMVLVQQAFTNLPATEATDATLNSVSGTANGTSAPTDASSTENATSL